MKQNIANSASESLNMNTELNLKKMKGNEQ